jgi:hypothetical protein
MTNKSSGSSNEDTEDLIFYHEKQYLESRDSKRFMHASGSYSLNVQKEVLYVNHFCESEKDGWFTPPSVIDTNQSIYSWLI